MEIGQCAFRGCTSLASVSIPGSVTKIGGDAFKNCNIAELTHPCLTIRDGLVIQDGVLLYCASQLESIVIPEGVTKIGQGAFRDCTSLTSVSIPAGGAEIGGEAFGVCTPLAEIRYAGTKAQWAAMQRGASQSDFSVKSILCRDGKIEDAESCCSQDDGYSRMRA